MARNRAAARVSVPPRPHTWACQAGLCRVHGWAAVQQMPRILTPGSETSEVPGQPSRKPSCREGSCLEQPATLHTRGHQSQQEGSCCEGTWRVFVHLLLFMDIIKRGQNPEPLCFVSLSLNLRVREDFRCYSLASLHDACSRQSVSHTG